MTKYLHIAEASRIEGIGDFFKEFEEHKAILRIGLKRKEVKPMKNIYFKDDVIPKLKEFFGRFEHEYLDHEDAHHESESREEYKFGLSGHSGQTEYKVWRDGKGWHCHDVEMYLLIKDLGGTIIKDK